MISPEEQGHHRPPPQLVTKWCQVLTETLEKHSNLNMKTHTKSFTGSLVHLALVLSARLGAALRTRYRDEPQAPSHLPARAASPACHCHQDE